MQRRKLFSVALASVLATGGLAACSESPNSNSANGGKAAATFLTVGMPNGPQTENFNPFLSTSAANSLGFKWMIYEPLMMWNPVKPPEPSKPWLATGAEWAQPLQPAAPRRGPIELAQTAAKPTGKKSTSTTGSGTPL